MSKWRIAAWSMLTRTRPMWGLIPLRVIYGVIVLQLSAQYGLVWAVAGLLVIPGVMTRLAGLAMTVVLLFGTPLDPQLHWLLLGISLLLVVSGPGRHSVDHWLALRHLRKHPSKKWSLYCLAETPYTKWWE